MTIESMLPVGLGVAVLGTKLFFSVLSSHSGAGHAFGSLSATSRVLSMRPPPYPGLDLLSLHILVTFFFAMTIHLTETRSGKSWLMLQGLESGLEGRPDMTIGTLCQEPLVGCLFSALRKPT